MPMAAAGLASPNERMPPTHSSSSGGAPGSGELPRDDGPPAQGSKENQLRKLPGGQQGETAAIVSPTERQAPVAVKTVPAQVRDLERFAAHGLHGVPEESLYLTHLDRHVQCRPPNMKTEGTGLSWFTPSTSARTLSRPL